MVLDIDGLEISVLTAYDQQSIVFNEPEHITNIDSIVLIVHCKIVLVFLDLVFIQMLDLLH